MPVVASCVVLMPVLIRFKPSDCKVIIASTGNGRKENLCNSVRACRGCAGLCGRPGTIECHLWKLFRRPNASLEALLGSIRSSCQCSFDSLLLLLVLLGRSRGLFKCGYSARRCLSFQSSNFPKSNCVLPECANKIADHRCFSCMTTRNEFACRQVSVCA